MLPLCRCAAALLLGLSLTVAAPCLDGPEPGAETPGTFVPAADKLIVAEVGAGQVKFSDVFEIWEPIWREVMLQRHLGSCTSAEAREKLQAAWTTAVETAVREEVFYQEAVRHFDAQVETIAKRLFENQNETGANAYGRSYVEIQRNVRARMLDNVEEYLNLTVEQYAKRAGGLEELHITLARQGLTWEAWKDRIRRKAFVQGYLNTAVPLTNLARIRPADIRDYYHGHADEFRGPPALRFRHLFLSFEKRGGEEGARAAAAEVYGRITEENLSFAAAAEQYSDDAPSARAGGLEPLPETGGEPDPEALSSKRLAWLEDVGEKAALFPPGKLGPVMISNHGFHLVQVEESTPGKLLPFQAAQVRIEEKLQAEKRERLIQKHYQELREEVRVAVRLTSYPEKYSWEAVSSARAAPPSPAAEPAPEPAP